jgi:hypothetical protein
MRRPRLPALSRDERGLALVLSLIAMVVIAALISGVFVASRQEMAGGRSAVRATQATEAAEAGLNDMLANWSVAYNTYGIYGDSTFPSVMVGPSGRYSQVLTRMQGGKFLLRVRGDQLGAAGNVIATRYLGRYLRLAIPNLDIQAALTAQDGVTAGGNIDVTGFDSNPPNWTGCAGSTRGGPGAVRRSPPTGRLPSLAPPPRSSTTPPWWIRSSRRRSTA